jgi:hypothetical protein
VKERRRVVVVFKGDKLVGFEGDVVPQGMGKPIERGPAVDKPGTVPADLLEKL